MDIIKAVIEQLDISKVISDYLGKSSKKTGGNEFWICPFHNDSTPSLCVNAKKKM